jgi:hypothetical protein
MLTHAAGRAWTAVLEHTLVRDAVTALDSRQLRRIELAKQAKVVGDDPDGRDKTLRDNENVDRAYLDVALRRRHGAQWRRERADVASAHEECDDDPVGCLDGVQDVHAEPVKGLLQRPRPADQFHDGMSRPFTTTGSAYTSRKAASTSSQESTGCVHSGKSRPGRSITAPVCCAVADAATAGRGSAAHAADPARPLPGAAATGRPVPAGPSARRRALVFQIETRAGWGGCRVAGSALQPVPRPSRNAHALGNLVSRLGVAGHFRGGGPGEVIVQDLPERPGRFQAGILHRLVETLDRPPVHLLVRAVAAVHPHDRRLVSAGAGIGGRTAEGLGPVRGESLAVLRMESVAERVADDLVGHHPGMPRLGQAEQALAAARGLIHTLHATRLPGRRDALALRSRVRWPAWPQLPHMPQAFHVVMMMMPRRVTQAVLYELVAVEPPELMAISAMRWENEFSLAGIPVTSTAGSSAIA